MFSPRTRTLLVACLITGAPAFAQAPATIDSPLQMPGLVWDDAINVVSAPWRCSPEDWTQAAVGAAAVLGTALLLDRPIQKAIVRNDTPSLKRWGNHLEPLGNVYSFAIAGGLYGFGYLAKNGEAQSAGADALAAMAIAGAALIPLKYGVGRARPDENVGNDTFSPFSSRDSFPSAHTTFAFTAAAAITEHYSEPWMQVTAYGLATLAGLARLEQNVHWTSDVLAGALLGTTIGKVVTRMNQRTRFGQRGQVRFTAEPQLGLGYQGLRLAMVF